MSRKQLALVVFAVPAMLHAQSTSNFHCHPGASTNEARLLAFFAGPLTFSSMGGAERLPAGGITLAGDLSLVPKPSGDLNRSAGECGFSKSEHTGLASIFPRPRILVGLGGGFTASATYLPPVTVEDATPNFASVALAWVSSPGDLGLDLTVRAHATLGNVKGPITCPRDALQSNPAQPCNGTEPSKDTYAPNVRGVEGAIGHTGGMLSWYAGAGINSLSPHFQVDFTDRSGNVDHNTIDVTLTRVAVFGGVGWDWFPALTLMAQAYSVPQDATTFRVGIAWRLQ